MADSRIISLLKKELIRNDAKITELKSILFDDPPTDKINQIKDFNEIVRKSKAKEIDTKETLHLLSELETRANKIEKRIKQQSQWNKISDECIELERYSAELHSAIYHFSEK